MSKYGEPWHMDGKTVVDVTGNRWFYNNRGGNNPLFVQQGQDIVERAAACVNALADVEHPEAVAEVIKAARHIAEGRVNSESLRIALAKLDGKEPK
jgi:hypothetical protein